MTKGRFDDPSADERFYAHALTILAGPTRRVALLLRICNVAYWLSIMAALAWLFSQVIDRAPPVTVRSARLVTPDVVAGDPVRVEYDVRRDRTCRSAVSWAIYDGADEVHRYGPVHVEAAGNPGQESMIHAWSTPTNAAAGSARLRVSLSWECPGNYLQAVYPVTLVLDDIAFTIAERRK